MPKRQCNHIAKQELGLCLERSEKNTIYRTIQHSYYSNIFKNIFNDCNVALGSTNRNNLGTMLNNGKTKTPTLEKSGVYQLTCNDCPAMYIGETGRQIGVRVKEHLKKNDTSAFGRHLNISGHTFDTASGIKILHQLNKGQKMMLLEAYEIKRAQDDGRFILNEQLELNFTPIHEYL